MVMICVPWLVELFGVYIPSTISPALGRAAGQLHPQQLREGDQARPAGQHAGATPLALP